MALIWFVFLRGHGRLGAAVYTDVSLLLSSLHTGGLLAFGVHGRHYSEWGQTLTIPGSWNFLLDGLEHPLSYKGSNRGLWNAPSQGEVEEIKQHNSELCKENQELKDSCVSLQKQNSDLQAELQKKQVWLLVKGEFGVWRSELEGAS